MNKIIKNFLKKMAYILPDKLFLKIKYYCVFGEKLNLKKPEKYNEKLQWLKLYDRKKIYTTMVDKYEVKEYVANIIGKQYIIPTLGVYEYFEEIDFEELPNQFVIKCTHDSGGVIICKDKEKLDMDETRKKINKALKNNYYKKNREWPYKNVKRRIIIEKYMNDNTEEGLKDYKFFCFNGVPKIMYISNDYNKNTTTDFFDMNFNHLDLRMRDPNANIMPKKPEKFDEMKKLCRKLSKNLPHARIDFYIIDNNIYFGEITFFHNAGYSRISPSEWNKILGSWIEIPNK